MNVKILIRDPSVNKWKLWYEQKMPFCPRIGEGVAAMGRIYRIKDVHYGTHDTVLVYAEYEGESSHSTMQLVNG